MIKDNYSLTEAQIQHFEVFGFLVRREVFSPEEIKTMNEEFDHRLASLKAEADSNEDRLFNNWPNRNPQTPYIASLLEDPRIYGPSEQLLGEDCVPVHSNANSYAKSSAWHPDTKDAHLLMVKNVMYLQPTTAERGALRVIPGSHKNPLHESLLRIGLDCSFGKESRYLKDSGLRGEDIPSYAFCSQPGDLIMFNQRLWHAAFGGYEDRRTCTYNFYQNPKSAKEKEVMHKQLEVARNNIKYLGTVGPQYHPWWLENPEGNPRRARWIKFLNDWGFVEAKNN